MTEQSREARVRRLARKEGERIVKVRESSPDYGRYGPYMVIDAHSNAVVAHGCELEGLEREYK